MIYRDIEHSIDILSMFVYPSLAHEIYNLPNEMKCVYWECVRNHFRLNDGRQAKCFIITCTSPSIFPLLATRLLEHWALHYWINLHHHTNVERERETERVEVVEGVKSAGNIVIMMSEIDFSRAFLLPHSFILFKWTVLNWGIWNDFFFCYANDVVIMQSRESILESENEENEEREEENWGFSRRHRIERKFFILKIQLF